MLNSEYKQKYLKYKKKYLNQKGGRLSYKIVGKSIVLPGDSNKHYEIPLSFAASAILTHMGIMERENHSIEYDPNSPYKLMYYHDISKLKDSDELVHHERPLHTTRYVTKIYARNFIKFEETPNKIIGFKVRIDNYPNRYVQYMDELKSSGYFITYAVVDEYDKQDALVHRDLYIVPTVKFFSILPDIGLANPVVVDGVHYDALYNAPYNVIEVTLLERVPSFVNKLVGNLYDLASHGQVFPARN